jgi:hypothetical protein
VTQLCRRLAFVDAAATSLSCGCYTRRQPIRGVLEVSMSKLNSKAIRQVKYFIKVAYKYPF